LTFLATKQGSTKPILDLFFFFFFFITTVKHLTKKN